MQGKAPYFWKDHSKIIERAVAMANSSKHGKQVEGSWMSLGIQEDNSRGDYKKRLNYRYQLKVKLIRFVHDLRVKYERKVNDGKWFLFYALQGEL